MNDTSKDISVIADHVSNQYITYLVSTFLNGLMGEGEITNAVIHDILNNNDIFRKIQQLTPPIDADFIRKIVAILGSNNDFFEALKEWGQSGKELEHAVIVKLRARIEGYP